jgi:hypothetical protein
MKQSSGPLTAVQKQARRNYVIFSVACTAGLTALVAVTSFYLN